jgi:hypothetical protein
MSTTRETMTSILFSPFRQIMTNPVLRNIRRANTAEEIAALLKKHIGLGTNQQHCREAYEAVLARAKDPELKSTAEVLGRIILSDHPDDWCQTMRLIINALPIWTRPADA